VYESHYVLEYIEAKFPGRTPMLSQDIDERLFIKKVEIVADGVCDALILLFFEKKRAECKARQVRKIDGGFNVLVA
jgi:glutathione S-transferase